MDCSTTNIKKAGRLGGPLFLFNLFISEAN